MDYEIIATLGPSSQDEAAWTSMLSVGTTAFRLNTSHLTLEQLQVWLERFETFFSKQNYFPALTLDLQGSKWRLGYFDTQVLEEGQVFELIHATNTKIAQQLPVPHTDFFKAVPFSDGIIVLNDAKIRLVVESFENHILKTRVIQGGKLSSRKGITFSSCDYRVESLSEKDQTIIDQTRNLNFIRYAISYIKDAAEMARYRQLLGEKPYLIAKLERKEAIKEALQISEQANELWICRGDLGAELGIKNMAETVFQFSEAVTNSKIPVMMAGQVLEHMVDHPTPTRSEVCFLFEALKKGYKGVVLSDEVAVGQYPVESCAAAGMFKSQ